MRKLEANFETFDNSDHEVNDIYPKTRFINSLDKFSRNEDTEKHLTNKNIPDWRTKTENLDDRSELKECNPNYSKGIEWQTNCQRCVPTFEMRKRGYDVTSLPAEKKGDAHLSYHPFDAWENAEINECVGSGLDEIQNEMAKWGDGSRAQVVVVWKNTNSGHTFVAEQIGDKTRFLDPQTGEMDVSYYFDSVEYSQTRFCRIDDIEASNRISDCCKEAQK